MEENRFSKWGRKKIILFLILGDAESGWAAKISKYIKKNNSSQVYTTICNLLKYSQKRSFSFWTTPPFTKKVVRSLFVRLQKQKRCPSIQRSKNFVCIRVLLEVSRIKIIIFSVSSLDDVSFVSAEDSIADLRDFDENNEPLDLGIIDDVIPRNVDGKNNLKIYCWPIWNFDVTNRNTVH